MVERERERERESEWVGEGGRREEVGSQEEVTHLSQILHPAMCRKGILLHSLALNDGRSEAV